MRNYYTVNETADVWKVKETQVTRYCREGRIEGAVKEKGVWKIPQDAQKPEWGKKSVSAAQHTVSEIRKPLPVGVSSYKDACRNYYYIDKTMMIKDFLDERPKVALFTRPRRFGKTLTMDMLRTYFEMTVEDTSIYFQDKIIWQQGTNYQDVQGKYPVIYLSFKDAKKNSWGQTLEHISLLITSEFRRHGELKTSPHILNKDYYEKIVNGTVDQNQMDVSLRELTQMLHEHYGVAPIVIIDEYDTPIQQGYAKGFYEDTVDFMRNLFSGAFKDNDHLTYGFLTGILRVAKESIFSGLNNLKIYSVLDNRFSQYFGFTSAEVKQMAQYYQASDKFNEICNWYDGYRFGNTEIFNPWSVINYFSNDCQPRPFWENTGSNTIIGDILEHASEDIFNRLNELLQGDEITTLIDTNVIYPEIKNNPSSIYSFLLVAGYLKLSKFDMSSVGDFICKVSLPNREIAYVYRKEVIGKLSSIVPPAVSVSIQEALYLGDTEALQNHIQNYLKKGKTENRKVADPARAYCNMRKLTGTNWGRDALTEKYSTYDFPYINLGADIDITGLYDFSKKNNISFYCAMIHAVTKTALNIKNFRYRLLNDGSPVEYDTLLPSFTYLPEGEEQFYIVEVPYEDDLISYATKAKETAEKMAFDTTHSYMHGDDELNILYISCIPWIKYTHFIRTIEKGGQDNIPRISWGKYEKDSVGRLKMPLSVQVHHGLMDGYHVGMFFMKLEEYLRTFE